jgi:amino acid transporter
MSPSMFEIIGLFVSLLLLVVISAIIGAIYAAIAYLILRTRPHDRKKKIRRAASLPLRFAFYLLACAIVFDNESGQRIP